MLKIRQCHWTWKIKLKTEIDKDMILVLKGISQKKKMILILKGKLWIHTVYC